MIEIKTAYDNLDAIRDLFREYAKGLGVDLCFQDFEQELSSLPGKYARPKGRLYLAYDRTEAIACIALRPFDEHVFQRKAAHGGQNLVYDAGFLAEDAQGSGGFVDAVGQPAETAPV